MDSNIPVDLSLLVLVLISLQLYAFPSFSVHISVEPVEFDSTETVQVTSFSLFQMPSCHQQGHVSSTTLLQQNDPVLNRECQLMQVVLNHGCKTVVVIRQWNITTHNVWRTVTFNHFTRGRRYFTKLGRPTQPPTPSVMGNEYQPNSGDALQLGSSAGVAHSTCR